MRTEASMRTCAKTEVTDDAPVEVDDLGMVVDLLVGVGRAEQHDRILARRDRAAPHPVPVLQTRGRNGTGDSNPIISSLLLG